MIGELNELLDIAMHRETAAAAFYLAGLKKTTDQGAIALMKELAENEHMHLEWIKQFKEKGFTAKDWSPKVLTDLKISEQLVDTKIPEKAGLQDVITAAMKREQAAVEFYTQTKQVMASPSGKSLCDKLLNEERKHKLKLENYYDGVFNKEN